MHRPPAGVVGWLDAHISTYATILLSAAALGTSWAGYQSTLWSGDQNELANEATERRTKAVEASTKAGQLTMIDVSVFASWLSAVSSRDTVLSRFLRDRFRPEFKVAFEKWLAGKPLETAGAPPTPFVMPEYRLSTEQTAALMHQAADSLAAASADANRRSDGYVLDAVILATVMFFSTAAQQSGRSVPRMVLLGLATAVCVMGLLRLLVLPVA